ncbi:MAG: hypothetical protein KC621_05160 [Myxococcales bacterium]|nr:hypothetical protein [Myxococcales bacterium]
MNPVTLTDDGFEARLALGEDLSRGPLAFLTLICGTIVFGAGLSGSLGEAELLAAVVIFLVGPAVMFWRLSRRGRDLRVVVRGPRLALHGPHGSEDWLLVELGASPMRIRGDYLTMRCPDGRQLTWDVRSVAEANLVASAVRQACSHLATRADPAAAPAELQALRSLVERDPGGSA